MPFAPEQGNSTLPPEFDMRIYRERNPGLANMNDAELSFHYYAHGRSEGRVCSEVRDRYSFLNAVPVRAKILEIGPSWAPAFRRPTHDVTYVDVYDTKELQCVANRDPNSQDAKVPEIDYVWRGEAYHDLIGDDFDVVFSSHNIEHQPNLIGHLRDIASVMRPSGLFVLVIPDKRFCFDHFLPVTDIADVLEAHVHRRTRHAVRKVIADQMMHAHNDAKQHWLGEHGSDPRFDGPNEYRSQCILRAMAYHDAGDTYIDAHAWQFTPDTFKSIINELHAVKMSPLKVARLYSTVFGSFEFYALLEKCS